MKNNNLSLNFLKRQSSRIPLLFMFLIVICFYLANVSLTLVGEQVAVRFIRNGILVLSLVIPIAAGMGLNFGITIGAMAAQGAYLVSLNLNLQGRIGVLVTFVISVILALIIGYILGILMNKVKGKEMITSIVIAALANYIYQLIFMAGFGTLIPINNENIALSTSIGVKNMVDLKSYKGFFESFGSIKIGGISVSIFLIIVVIFTGFIVYYILNTSLGQRIKAIGISEEKAANLGISVDKTRIIVIIISTVLAAIGQFIYLQNIGSLNVYTEHLNTDVMSCAALLAGGASIKRASVKNALYGTVILHILFVLSPLAGQNFFDNVALGEYFRTFIMYGVIAFALVINIKLDNNRAK